MGGGGWAYPVGGERGEECPEEPEEWDWGLREGCFGLVEVLRVCVGERNFHT